MEIEWDRKAIEEIKERKSGLAKWKLGVIHKLGKEYSPWNGVKCRSKCGRLRNPIRLSRTWKGTTCKMCRKKKKGENNGRG